MQGCDGGKVDGPDRESQTSGGFTVLLRIAWAALLHIPRDFGHQPPTVVSRQCSLVAAARGRVQKSGGWAGANDERKAK